MRVIQFPLERAPGAKPRRLGRQVNEVLQGMHLDLARLQLELALDHLGAVARLRRQTRPLDTSFHRDRQGRAQ